MDRLTAPVVGEGLSKGRGCVIGPDAAEGGSHGSLAGETVSTSARGPADELISVVDLFGEPVPLPRGPGRPRHVPTAASRARVRELRQRGDLDHLAIAAAIGITGPTLRLNYAVELGSQSVTGERRDRRDQARGS